MSLDPIDRCQLLSPIQRLECELPNRHWESVDFARHPGDRDHFAHDTSGSYWRWSFGATEETLVSASGGQPDISPPDHPGGRPPDHPGGGPPDRPPGKPPEGS